MGTETEVDSILVLIAALNEESGIRPTLIEIGEVLNGVPIIVIDGGSRDKTIEIAKDCGAQVIVQKDDGKGDALKRALSKINANPEYIVLIDADYTYPAKSIPEMVDILDTSPEIGMVCGNRFNTHLHLGKMHNLLYFGNRMLAFWHNLFNGVQMSDPLTGLRVVRWEILRNWLPRSKGFDVEVELNHFVERRGYDIVEVPINYRRRLGKKKLKIKDGLVILGRILRELGQDLVYGKFEK